MSARHAYRKIRFHEGLEILIFLCFVALLWGIWPLMLRNDRELARRQIGGFSAPFAVFIGPQKLSDFLSDPSFPHEPHLSQNAAGFIQADWLQAPNLAAGFQIALPAPTATPRAPFGGMGASDWTPASFQVPSYRLPRVTFPLEIAPQTNGAWFLDIPDDISLDEAELRAFTTGVVDRVDAAADLLFNSHGFVECVLLPPEMTAFTAEERSQIDRILRRAQSLSATNGMARIRWFWRK